uniref:Uncharacterized protein n=1 Tax=Arundo donax TaxID=35708 RepID=A0A0A8Z2F5_ARUDO
MALQGLERLCWHSMFVSMKRKIETNILTQSCSFMFLRVSEWMIYYMIFLRR